MTAAARLTHDQVESILVTPAGGGALDRAGAERVARELRAQAVDLPGVTRVAPAQLEPGRHLRCWSTSTCVTPWTTSRRSRR